MPDDIQSLAQSNAIVLPESRGFDYYWLCSGQDFPLVESETIVDFLKRAENKNFINFFASKKNRLGKDNHYNKRNQIVFPKGLVSPKSQL